MEEPKEITISISVLSNNTINLGEVIRSLEATGISLTSSMILYYDNSRKIFHYCGFDKDADNYFINLNEIQEKIQIKYRKLIHIEKPIINDDKNCEDNKECNDEKQKGKSKRTKEREIGEIVAKVAEWRKLYGGVDNSDGIKKKYSLEDAAEMVGIAKKTLDDYLLQIRAGHQYNFDFEAYREARVGILRKFVKERKDKNISADLEA